MITLSVDPAMHGCGLVLWSGKVLIAAGYAPNTVKSAKSELMRVAAAAKAAIEWARPRLRVACAHCEGMGSIDGDPCIACDAYGNKDGEWIGALVVELPQVYQRGANKSKGDPNKNVLPLVMVDAALAVLLSGAEVSEYQPHAWKGGTEKPKRVSEKYVVHERVLSRLLPEELACVEWPKAKERCWDVDDAIGVGLHHLGRFEAFKKFARE